LSVVMTNYNHGHYLNERIPSILSQLPLSSEFIIVDDASTDNSVSIIQKFVEGDSRINFIRNKKNLGVVFSANIAFKAAQGKYVTSLAADDKILPGFIDKTLQVLLDHPDIAICCSDCGLCFEGFSDKDPNAIETTKLLKTSESLHVFSPKKLPKIFRTTNFWIPGHTSIIKMSAIKKHGYLNKNLESLCDWFLFHSIALEEGVAYIPQTLAIWRQHNYNNNFSSTVQNDKKRKKSMYLQLFKILSEKKNRKIRSQFRKATILQFYVKQLFFTLIWQPKQWDIIATVLIKVFRRRLRRYLALEKN